MLSGFELYPRWVPLNSPLTVDVRFFLYNKLPIAWSKSLLKLPVVSGIQVKMKLMEYKVMWGNWDLCLVERFVCLAGKYIYNYADKAPFAQASQDNS